jgi:predicted nuclease of predicted toxin-antitoxin system
VKILLDENLPKRLKRELSMFDVATVREMGWQGRDNGELIRAAMQNGFSALLTFDKNLQYQQNFGRYPITVVLLSARDNQFNTLRPLMPAVIEKLNAGVAPGVIQIKAE